MTHLAIVLTLHNQNEIRVKNCLRSLAVQQTTYEYGVYVVDYGSTDGMADTIGEIGSDKIFYMHIDRPTYNISHAHNIAIQMVEAHHFCMMDEHLIARDDMVQKIMDVHQQHELLMVKGVTKPLYVPEVYLDAEIHPDVDLVAELNQHGTECLYVLQGVGSGPRNKRVFVTEKEPLVRIRGYDEDLVYDEDSDVVRRLAQSGVYLVPFPEEILAVYQVRLADAEYRRIVGPKLNRELQLSESQASLRRKTPERNLNREWGQI